MLKPLHSHKPAISTTFIPKDRPDIIQQLNKITFNSKDALYKNYIDMNWLSFEAISIYTMKDEIVGFSTILKRDKYFDKNEERIHLLVHGKKTKEFYNYVKAFAQP